MNRRAFTLIELLVVIAIIAILAAILFPVFAQAKLAAKGAASISNIKQIALSSIMYSDDNDDVMVKAGAWGICDPDAAYPDPTCTDPDSNYASLAQTLYPYLRTCGINTSPLGNSSVQGGEIAKRTGTRFMSYGFNYAYLNPAYYPATPIVQSAVSQTAVASVANTVLFTEHVSRGNQDLSSMWYMGPGTALWLGLAEIPDCYTNPDIWCLDGWGNDGIYAAAVNSEAEGKFTGGNAPRKSGQIPTGWVDGHVSSVSPGALAAGTNWTKVAGGVANGTIVITDRSKYVWDTAE